MASRSTNLTVTVTATELVTASPSPFQRHRLPLSNLDLVIPRAPMDISLFFCYAGNKTTSFEEKAGALKKALAETLVSFYPFAGEVVENSVGEPEIDCNNRGVEFYEAQARGVELGEVNLYEPDGCVRGKLVPNKKNGVFSVQFTELASGATVVGCTFDHRVADAYSTNMFVVAWAQIATSTTVTTTPSFGRTLLNPRRPLSFDSSIDEIFVTYSSLPPPAPPTVPAMTISRIYNLHVSQLSSLQNEATTNQNLPSKLNTLSSYLWKLIAEHASKTKKTNAQNTCTMGIAVDGRKRLGPAMSSHFGNVISVPYASYKVNDLTKMPIADVAEVISGVLANAATKEHFLGLVDWIEAHRPKPIVAKLVCTYGSEAEPAFVVSSGQRFPVTKVDFGWGKPVFGSYYLPTGRSAGYVMPMPSPNENGDWIVYMRLLESQLNFIEEKASSVFVPFTLDLVTH